MAECGRLAHVGLADEPFGDLGMSTRAPIVASHDQPTQPKMTEIVTKATNESASFSRKG